MDANNYRSRRSPQMEENVDLIKGKIRVSTRKIRKVSKFE